MLLILFQLSFSLVCDVVDGLPGRVSGYPPPGSPASLGSRHGPGLVLSSGGRNAALPLPAAGGSGDSESELSVISSNKTCMCMMYPHVSLLRETKDPKWNLRGWNRVSMK